MRLSSIFKRHISSLFGIRAEIIQQAIESLILALIVLVVFLFSANPKTQVIALPFYVIAFILLGIIFVFYKQKTGRGMSEFYTKSVKIMFFALTAGVLFWVANTGWFLSPFFYLLYLVVLSLAFLFSPSVVFTFVILLVAVLAPSIGQVDGRVDIVSALALGLIIPLSYFLRREYLKRIQQEKKILILEEKTRGTDSLVAQVLANKITNLGAKLREPLNDIRQIAFHAEETGLDKRKLKDIVVSSDRAIAMVKEFEEEATGKKLVSTPKKGKKASKAKKK